jgi:hypothetical protein
LLSSKCHYVPLQAGPQLHFCRNELPPHQQGPRDNKPRAAHRQRQPHQHRRLSAAAVIPSCASMQVGPFPHLPTGGDNRSLKPKSWKLAPDSPTNGGDHLCIDGSPAAATTSAPMGSSCTSAHEEVFAPVLTTGVRTRPSKNAAPTRKVYDVLYDLPVRLEPREKPWMWPTRAWCDRCPCSGRATTLYPSGRRQHRRRHQSRPGRGARHAAADSATDGERPSPPNTEGRSGPLPTWRWGPNSAHPSPQHG